jgi:hypothetical protein
MPNPANFLLSAAHKSFISFSLFKAPLRVKHFSLYTNFTGRRLRVYFDAFPELCLRTLFLKSVVLPV